MQNMDDVQDPVYTVTEHVTTGIRSKRGGNYLAQLGEKQSLERFESNHIKKYSTYIRRNIASCLTCKRKIQLAYLKCLNDNRTTTIVIKMIFYPSEDQNILSAFGGVILLFFSICNFDVTDFQRCNWPSTCNSIQNYMDP